MKIRTLLPSLLAWTVAAHAYDSVVVFNEIQYNAPAGQSEWIELRNNQGVDANLAGWKLSGGVDYTFPPGTTIPGGGYLLIAAVPGAVPGSMGPFTGSLDNGGETLRLRNQNDRIMDEVSYDDEGDWPVGADGSGATLSRRVEGAHSGAAAWQASSLLGGTPGAANSFQPAPPVRTEIIPMGSFWKYDASGSDLGTAWRGTSFDDSGWSTGQADFSFGGGLLYTESPPAPVEWGEWSILPWVDDASTLISTAKTYTHKADLFHNPASPTVINGVTIDGFNAAAAASYSGPNWTLAGANSSLGTNTGAPRNLMPAGSGSRQMLNEFYYGAAGTIGGAASTGSTLTLTGLTPGQYYIFTNYVTGWDARDLRLVRLIPSNTNAPIVIDEGARGQGGGMLVRYHYKAPASGTLSITYQAGVWTTSIASWHHYGFTNEVASALPQEQTIEGPISISEVSSETANRSAANIINANGYATAGGGHTATADGNMWLSTGSTGAPADPLPAAITFDLGSPQTLSALRVWNYNEMNGTTDTTTKGAKDVEVLTSPDAAGETFTSRGTMVFTRATASNFDIGERYGLASPVSNVRRVRLNITSNYGDAGGQAGLSEIRFLKPYVHQPYQLKKSPITSLYSTGVANDGAAATPGTQDLHYTSQSLTGTYPTAPRVMTPNAAWAPASAGSSWIGFTASGTDNIPTNNYTGTYAAFRAGLFNFRTTFDLTGYLPGTEEVKYSVACDNIFHGFTVNGQFRGGLSAGHTLFQGPWDLPGPFNAGSNTIDIQWANIGAAAGAGGVRVLFDARAARSALTTLASNPVTSYFRKSFNHTGAPGSSYLMQLQHGVDDAAVFYLNGQEIHRTNLSGPAAFNTPADAELTTPLLSSLITVPSTALNANGANVLAVELHQASTGANDAYFDASLQIIETPQPPAEAALIFSEIESAAAPAFYVELVNRSSAPVSTAGWSIVSSAGQSYALPAQTLAAGAFLSINAAALGFTPADGDRLYLQNGTTQNDAREVTSRIRGLTAGGHWGHPTSVTPGAANVVVVNSDVVINEIFYHGLGTSPEQWIELHNKGAAPVDISGWKFSDGVSFSFPATPATVLPAGGYLVVAWNPATFSALHPAVLAAAVFGPWTGSLSGSGELITLRDAADNIADQVRYADGGRWSQWADGGGSSLELKNPGANNAIAEAWDASDESMATGWENVTYSGLGNGATTSAGYTYYNEFLLGLLDAGEVLVDDIVVSELTTGAVVRPQLIQNGSFTSGTADKWRNIGSHQRTSIVDDPFSPGNKVMKISATAATEHMHNNCGTTLKDGAAYVSLATGSTYTISFRAKWLRGTNRLHSRLYLNRLPKQTQLALPATGGTPGAQNSRYVSDAAPTFSDLSVSPVVPLAGQPATVRVKIHEVTSLAGVLLYTSVNGAPFNTASMTLIDGYWTAVIPAQASGASVQFYIRATDGNAQMSRFPAEGAASRAMIPWEDGRSRPVMPSGARVHNLRIVMPAADANDMYLAENVMSNFYRPCTFIVNDSVAYYNVGTRLKSSEHGRFQEHRAGFNIKFGSDQLFLGAHETISIDKSGNRSNEGLDGTGVTSQREILLKAVMNAAGGIYSQEDDLVRMIPTIASGSPAPRFTGINGLGEAILSKSRFDDEYLDGQWDNGGSGALFKQEYIYPVTATIDPVTRAETAITSGGNLTALSENPKTSQTGGSPGPAGIAVQAFAPASTGTAFSIDPKENYRWHWLIRNARGDDDYSGLISAITAIGQPQGTPAFKTQTEAALDVDTWLRSAAVPMMWMVTDNYLGNGSTHNAIIYFPPGQKGLLIPWDCDFLSQTTANATSWSMTNGGSISKFIADGANQRRYWCHVLDILNRSFNDAFLTQWATHYARFGPDDLTTSLPVLRLRANYLRDIIMGTNVSGSNAGLTRVIPFTAFSRTSASPVTTATPFTSVTGDGWLDIENIRLQGSPAPLAVTWTDNNSWTLQLPVSAGTVTYTLEAVRKDGSIAGTVTVEVTGTGGIFPAGPGNLVASEIHFNPPGPGDTTEFLELLNITTATLDMSGCHFDDNGQGIAFTFPVGYTIAPGARILIVRDSAAFAAAYPGAGPIAGTFTGALDNSGEEIVLFAASGLEIFRFTYTDGIGSTDGNGRSLVRVIGCLPNPAAYSWRASTADGGNPGTSDAIMFTGNPLDDADGDGHAAIVEYAFGTSDTTWNAATDFQTPNGILDPLKAAPLPNADCALVEHQSSSDLINWTTAPSSARRYWRWKVTLQ